MTAKLEPVIWLLAGLVVFFTLLLFVCAELLASDGQTFQVISGLLTGFGGALLMRVKPRDAEQHPPGDTVTLKSVHVDPPAVPPAA